MTLADTSVWVDFFRSKRSAGLFESLLEANEILIHPWVVGELALGGLGGSRESVISDLGRLPPAPRVSDEDVLELVRSRSLWGRGIGWVDVQLLASALVMKCELWTFDTALAAVAEGLELTTVS